jgi:hypothetical protein
MLPLLLAGAAVGLARGYADQQREKKDRQTQAEIARYSPWTGMGPSPVKPADMLGSTMQGAMGGAMMGQAMGGGGGGGGTADGSASGFGDAGTPLAPGFGGAAGPQPYAATPAAAAAQQGTFGNYVDQNYTNPWAKM